MRVVGEHQLDVNMEVFVSFPGLLRFSNSEFPVGSLVQDVLDRFIKPLVSVSRLNRGQTFKCSDRLAHRANTD